MIFFNLACTPKAEVVFIVDGSSSIGSTNWGIITSFMASIVDSFDISDDAVSSFPYYLPRQ